MIMIRKLLLVIAIGMMVLALIDCKSGGDPAPDEKEVQLGKLTANWKCSGAVRDGVAQTGYDNFQVTISGTPGAETFNYSTTGRPALSPWPATGTWSFGTNVSTDMLRDSSLPVTYSATDSQLQLTFQFSQAGFPGRTEVVTGQWVFSFSK